jgi:hypothetical protein
MRCPECPFTLGCRPPLNTATGRPMPEEHAMCWLDSIPGARRPAEPPARRAWRVAA